MVHSNVRYIFGSKLARIETANFSCIVTTAKAGWFQNRNTIIQLVDDVNASRGLPVARFDYVRNMPTEDRLQLHDIIVSSLDGLGEAVALRDAVTVLRAKMESGGLVERVTVISAAEFIAATM